MSEVPEQHPKSGFPYLTVLATVVALFLFVAQVLIAYRSPNYLGDVGVEPKADPATKRHDVEARNRAVLDGNDPGTKLSIGESASLLVATADSRKDDKNPRGYLPFPVEPKAKDSKEKK